MKKEIIDSVKDDWWYYSVELQPGEITKGQYPDLLPMLPRMLQAQINLNAMECLDVGSMEGLMPVLMSRKGARKVVASDALPHCEKKMNALKLIYDVGFDFRSIGLLYDLSNKLKNEGGFDYINLSGVLYHVFSPMHVIAGVRPLLKRNGLMIVSTNVINRPDNVLLFNAQGEFQREANTFWYHSVPMLEYLIRFFKMVPIDCLYYPHVEKHAPAFNSQVDAGYLSVICRAVDDHNIIDGDSWASNARKMSWEFLSLCDNTRLMTQPYSSVTYLDDKEITGKSPAGINLLESICDPKRNVRVAAGLQNSHTLRLDDMF